jgi:hypothetical protein
VVLVGSIARCRRMPTGPDKALSKLQGSPACTALSPDTPAPAADDQVDSELPRRLRPATVVVRARAVKALADCPDPARAQGWWRHRSVKRAVAPQPASRVGRCSDSSVADVSSRRAEAPAYQRCSGASARVACRPLVRFVRRGSEGASRVASRDRLRCHLDGQAPCSTGIDTRRERLGDEADPPAPDHLHATQP